MTREEALDRHDRIRYNLLNHDDKVAVDVAFEALREQDVTDINVGNKTNADHIRSMTDEELADYMSEHSIEDFCYIVCGGNCKAMATFNKTSHQVCREIVADWLKQPYKEET